MTTANPLAVAVERRLGRAAFNAYRAAATAARQLPAGAVSPTASLLGLWFARAMQGRRRMIARHLQRVRPGLRGRALDQAVDAAFDSYARYWVESFRLPSLSRQVVEAGFSKEGYEYVLAGRAEGRGVILALPHLGGWEWAGRWLTEQGTPVTVVVEPLQPPELFEWFADLRRSLGMNVVPLGPGAGTAVRQALHENHVVCLLCDRDLKGTGVPVEFFGERTTLPAGPATLALRSGAPILPVGVYLTDRLDGHHAIVRPPIPIERTADLRADVTRITQALAHELEWLIHRAPEQWHLFQPNWPSDPGYGA